MRFHVIGIGAIGSLISHHLRRTLVHSPLTLIVQRDPPKTITVERDGVKMSLDNFEWQLFPRKGLLRKAFAQRTQDLLKIEQGKANRLEKARKRELYTPEHLKQPGTAERLAALAERLRGPRDYVRPPGEESVSDTRSEPGNEVQRQLEPHHASTGREYLPPTDPRHIQSIFITAKAHSAVSIAQELAPQISPASTIVLLQNGLGVYEAIVDAVFRDPSTRPHFVLATTTHGAFVKNTGHIVHSGIGELSFGLVSDPTGQRDFETSLLDKAEPERCLDDITPHLVHPSRTAEDLRYDSLRGTVAALLGLRELNPVWEPMARLQVRQRQKLAVNSIVNPITALMDCRNGQLYGRGSAMQMAKDLCQEAEAVFLAEARATRDDPTFYGVPELTRSSLYREYQRVVRLTAGNYSSMLRDARQGRVTEVAYINGFISSLGITHGIPTPKNDLMVQLMTLKSKLVFQEKLL